MLNSFLSKSAFASRHVPQTRVISSTATSFYNHAKNTSVIRSCKIAGSVNGFSSTARTFSSSSGTPEKVKGTVKWFDGKKGYGFITPVDGSDDVFVHYKSIYSRGFRSLMEGEDVEFEVIDVAGKRSAKDVTGPFGAYVKGKPASPRDDVYDRNRDDRYSQNRGRGYDQDRGGYSEDQDDNSGNYMRNDRYGGGDSGGNYQKTPRY